MNEHIPDQFESDDRFDTLLAQALRSMPAERSASIDYKAIGLMVAGRINELPPDIRNKLHRQIATDPEVRELVSSLMSLRAEVASEEGEPAAAPEPVLDNATADPAEAAEQPQLAYVDAPADAPASADNTAASPASNETGDRTSLLFTRYIRMGFAVAALCTLSLFLWGEVFPTEQAPGASGSGTHATAPGNGGSGGSEGIKAAGTNGSSVSSTGSRIATDRYGAIQQRKLRDRDQQDSLRDYALMASLTACVTFAAIMLAGVVRKALRSSP